MVFVEASLHVVYGLLGQLLVNCADSRHFRPQFRSASGLLTSLMYAWSVAIACTILFVASLLYEHPFRVLHLPTW